jgi:preprotein translocase subunit SecB
LGLDKRQPLPDVDVDAQFSLSRGLGPSFVGVTVRVQTKDDPTLVYRFHAELMAVIRAEGATLTPDIERNLLRTGVTILFPFVRENVANLTMRGRFGPMWIKPINVQAALSSSEPSAARLKSAESGQERAKSRKLPRLKESSPKK